MRRIVLYYFFLFLAIQISAQTHYSIKGKVQNEKGELLTGVAIALHETGQGAYTDVQGRYILRKVQSGHYHIHVQFLGYKSISKDIEVHRDTTILFTMEEAVFEMDEVILEVERLKKEQERSSISIQILDASKLNEDAAQDIGTIIEKQSGLNNFFVNAGIARPMIRGLGSNRIIVTENGIVQEGQNWGAEHGLEIDPDLLDRIEILKGPSSLIYGSGAIGGAINLQSYELADKNTYHVKWNSKFNSVNELWDQGIHLNLNQNGYLYGFKYSQSRYGDLKLNADTFEYLNTKYPIYEKRLHNTAGKQSAVSALVGVSKKWGKSIVQVSNFDQYAGFFPAAHGGLLKAEDYQPDGDWRNWDDLFQHIQHFKVISNTNILFKHHWLELDFSYQKNTRNEIEEINSSMDTSLQLIMQTVQSNFIYHFNKKEKVHWTLGSNQVYQFNATGGSAFLIDEFNRYAGGYFLLAEIGQKKLIWNVGGRIDHQGMSMADYNAHYLNWTADIGWNYKMDEAHSIRWNVGKSFRVPNIAELSSNGMHHGTYRYEQGDLSLQPEQAYQMDMAFHLSKKYIKLDIEPYMAYFSNYIYLSASAKFIPISEGGGQLYRYLQTQTFLSGVDFTMDAHFIEGLHLGLVIDYAHHYNLENGLGLPLTPPLKVFNDIRLELLDKHKKWHQTYFYIENKWIAPQNNVDRNEAVTPGFFVLNAGFRTRYNLYKDQLVKCSFGLNNITNATYLNHISLNRRLNLPALGRHFYIQLQVPLEGKIKHKLAHDHHYSEIEPNE